jgi:uncharacterized protein
LLITAISDTHMPKRGRELPKLLAEHLEISDIIIHAGDWQDLSVYKELSSFGRVEGVFGNTDSGELKEMLKDKLILNINGFKLGVVHGHGKGKTTEKRALDAFAAEKLDCLIYGHSHIPVLKKENGTLIINPGSPTDKRRQPRFSFAVIRAEKELSAELVYFDKES